MMLITSKSYESLPVRCPHYLYLNFSVSDLQVSTRNRSIGHHPSGLAFNSRDQ